MSEDSADSRIQRLLGVLRAPQYQAGEDPVVYRCKECGKVSVSIGWIHAHIEGHRGIFGFQFPWRYGDWDALMERTEVIRVDESSVVDIEEVEIRG